MKRKNWVIILKGAPGVGKSYVSRKLVTKLKGKNVARISIDELLHFDTRHLNRDKLKLAKFHAAILTRSFLREGFDIIIEYCFDIPSHLKFLLEKIQKSHLEKIPEADVHVFHLEADIPSLLKRNATRKDGTDAMPRAVLQRLADACRKTAGKIPGETIISTERLAPARVVEEILGKIK